METKMKMHPAKSSYAVHGLSADAGRSHLTGWVGRNLTRLVRAIGTMRRELAYRRAMAELARLDRRLLADIGIGEAEIYSAVRCGRAELSSLSRLHAGPRRPADRLAHRTRTERLPAPQLGDRPPRPLEATAGAPC
jgi:uncharacterized protein YjiS (DUF1127 family)